MAVRNISISKFYVWLILLLATSSLAFSQVSSENLSSGTISDLSQQQINLIKKNLRALESPIDKETFIVGPGDQLEFRVWGSIEILQVVVVGPDGNISIPTVGLLFVTGKTLAEAENFIAESALKTYPNSNTSVRLTGIRQMKVSISGAVKNPGSYVVSPVDRLSDIILASGDFSYSGKSNETGTDNPDMIDSERGFDDRKSGKSGAQSKSKASLRRIRIKNLDESETEVDYLKFRNSGDINYNPILSDGAQIYIPLAERETGVINIFGAVKSPGEYEFIETDNVIDIVRIAGGFNSNALLSDIKIVRFSQTKEFEEVIKFDYLEALRTGRKQKLTSDDRIFVREIPRYHQKYNVTIIGEVNFPGVYPVHKDSTRLTQIIQECGGFTERANLKTAKVIRKAIEEIEDPEYERLKKMSVAEMREMEYEYFKTRSREEAPAVVVNFEKLFEDGDKSQDIHLRDLDEIEIPAQLPTVNVTGQVVRPGLIRWIQGKDVEYYVEKAGGYSWNARKGKMRLIEAQTGVWSKPNDNTIVEIGDTIFVPEKQDIDYWELWKDLLLVVSQMATIVLVIQTVK